MGAPTVQALNDIVAQFTAAQQPEYNQIDTSINANDASGAGQVAGLNAAKDNAFGGITQAAVNRGGYFSGFTPDAQAKYTGATYLPALAKLQTTIANTRNTLLGQKATLASQANTNALTTQQQQQKELDAYNQQQEAAAAAAAEAERQRQFTASENAKNRSASAASAAAKAPSAAAVKQGAISSIGQALQGRAGRDGFVSPQDFALARNEWVNAGYSAADFNNNFRNYANLTYGPTSLTNYGLK